MKTIFPLLLLLLPFLLNAQEKPAKPAKIAKVDTTKLKHPVHAALWKVEGNGLEKASYLFGTIHLGGPQITTLHPNAQKAFEAAEILYTEIDLNPGAQIAMAPKLSRKDGKTFSESVGPDLAKRVNAALKDVNPALSTGPFEGMKTWIITSMLPTLELQLKGEKALDQVLADRAKAADKKTDSLETADSQLKIFDALTEKEQIVMLRETLDMLKTDKEAGKDTTQEMIDLYLTAKPKALGTFVKDQMNRSDIEIDKELSKRLMKVLLDDRNVSMTKSIDEALREATGKSHFFAVGVAHYTGKFAIQDLLKKEGYTITPAFK